MGGLRDFVVGLCSVDAVAKQLQVGAKKTMQDSKEDFALKTLGTLGF